MERNDDVIELGIASDDTRGPGGTLYYDEVLMRNEPGIAID